MALKMLMGDRAKYYGLILGITFAAVLIAQQVSIFLGMMRLSISQIEDVKQPAIWVMHPRVRFVDDVKPLSDNDLHRVRGVAGVKWAVPFFKGQARARLADGNYQQVIVLGLDDDTLIGAPAEMVAGSLADLRLPDAVIIDERGYRRIWPNTPYERNRTFEMTDRRAEVVGVCKASRTYQTFPIVYTRFSQATMFVPVERKVLSFVLVQGCEGLSGREICRRIEGQTDLKALTRDEFAWMTIKFYLFQTGIPLNFGVTVALGFLIGTAIAGQTFYLFTLENLGQYGLLKAMGVSNPRLVGMILLQGLVVGVIGYALGVGLAALFGEAVKKADKFVFYMPWHVLAGTAGAVMVIMMIASYVSIRRVLRLEPAVVFR